MFSPGALKELAFGDQRARRVDGRPVVRKGLNELFDVGVAGVESCGEVSDVGVLAVGVVGEAC